MNNVVSQSHQTFEAIRQIAEDVGEFWYARDLQRVLEYSTWEKFQNVITKAISACNNSGQSSEDHFHHVVKMVQIGSGAERKTTDYMLSRYACYLIIQNADPTKVIVASGQTYFAVQTRKQELADTKASEDQKRLYLRQEMKEHNKKLVSTAKQAGVETGLDYAIFQDHGYKGLYGGLGAKDLHGKKGLKKSQQILDHMGSTELAANLFRATQTEEKLRKENIRNKRHANQTHYDVGRRVRQTIEDIGGTMPENLPTADSIKKVERQEQKRLQQQSDADGDSENAEE